MTRGFLHNISASSLSVAVHQEPIGDIKYSADLGLVDSGSGFPFLCALPTTTTRPNGAADRIDHAFTTQSPFWSQEGLAAGVKLSGHLTVHVGIADKEGRALPVYASFVLATMDRFWCDGEHRAHMVLEAIDDRRDNAVHRDVRVFGISSLEEIAIWSAALPAGSPKAKMAFVYDVLLAESQGNVG